MGTRREGREICLQFLYLWDNCGLKTPEVTSLVTSKKDSGALDFAIKLLEQIIAKQTLIDQTIENCTLNWKLDRMAAVDRNILRIATFELLQMPETPKKVIINEAVEIAKKFSTDESGKFVNGILDKIAKLREIPNPAHDAPAS